MTATKRAKASAAPEPLTVDDLPSLVSDVSARFVGIPPAWWDHGAPARPAVLAFDVGKRGAVALVRQPSKTFVHPPCAAYLETLVDKGDLSPAWIASVRDALRMLRDSVRFGFARSALVLVEDVFLGRESPNVQSMLTICRRVGAIVTLASAHGFPVARVMSASWQSRMIGSIPRVEGVPLASGEKRAWNKAQSFAVAREMFGNRVDGEHVADAALLAAWAYAGPRVKPPTKATARRGRPTDATTSDRAVGRPDGRSSATDTQAPPSRAKERGASSASKRAKSSEAA